ncbi:MAG: GNAT family N-acetyltransferase [Elusimicrobiales bacterium]|nr:GNAT family N-acetyltransferase [Elusimicrobiales bacterium]
MDGAVKYRFLKKASAAQAAGVIALYRAQGWWTPGDGPAALGRLLRGSHCFLVAERGGAVIGMGRAISDRAGDAYLQDVAVLPSERGAGTGKALVAALCRRLRKDGITWIGLIAQNNSESFYARLGFRALRGAAPMLIKGARV